MLTLDSIALSYVLMALRMSRACSDTLRACVLYFLRALFGWNDDMSSILSKLSSPQFTENTSQSYHNTPFSLNADEMNSTRTRA